jgi:hypothetical protein
MLRNLAILAALYWIVSRKFSAETAQVHNTILRMFPKDFIVDSHEVLSDPHIAELTKTLPPKWIVQIVEEGKTKGKSAQEVLAQLVKTRDALLKLIQVNKDKDATPEILDHIKNEALAQGAQ